MTKAKVAPNILAEFEPTCGACRHWRRYDEEGNAGNEGACFLHPPLVRLLRCGDELIHRPTVSHDEFACGQFKSSH